MGECLQLRSMKFCCCATKYYGQMIFRFFTPSPGSILISLFQFLIKGFGEGGGRCLTIQVFCWTLVKGRVSTALSKIVDFLEQLIFIFMHQDTFSNA